MEPKINQSPKQYDKVKITHDDGTIEYGEFHRYGATRFNAIVFVDGIIRFVDEQSINLI